jgi:hypothetical protein
MIVRKLTLLWCGLFCLSSVLLADSLTFIAQPDPSTGFTNLSWFSALNWFTTDLVGNLTPAGRVPGASETATVIGTADADSSGIRVQTLILTNYAAFTNGLVAVEHLEMLGGSSIENATINALVTMAVEGSNCALSQAMINIASTASLTFSPVAPETTATLNLTQGSFIADSGAISLSDGSQIIGIGPPQNTLSVRSNALLRASGQCLIKGASAGDLLIDNSGGIQADNGSFSFGDNIDWESSSGLGEFKAASPTALLLFAGAFHVPTGVTSLLTGPGTNRIASGATIDGLLQVGETDPITQLFTPGNLDVVDSVDGVGTLEIAGTPSVGGVLTWENGAFSLAAINIEPGGQLQLDGTNGASRRISGCLVNNSGLCYVLNGDLVIDQGGAVSNLVGASFEVSGEGSSSVSINGNGVFDNAGLFRQTRPGTTEFGGNRGSLGPDFNNNGLVDLQAGQLALSGGTSSGEFRAGQGTVLWFSGGTHTLNTGASFTGDGSVRLAQGAGPATLQVNGTIIASKLEVSSNGVLLGPEAGSLDVIQIDTLVLSDNAKISNGTLQLQNLQLLDQSQFSGSIVNVANSLTVAGTNCVLSGTTLSLWPPTVATFRAVTPSTTAVLSLDQGATLNNLAGATCDLQGDGIVVGALDSGGGAVNNAGTFFKSAGSGISSIACAFTNSGFLHVGTGTMKFEDAWVQTSGNTIVDAGAVLASSTLGLQGGILTGTGTIAANVSNGGIVSPGGAPGVLVISPTNDYQQSAAGTLIIEIGGTNSGTQSDQLIVGGHANLGGQLALHFLNAFVPRPGDQFPILSCASQSGGFASITPAPPTGTLWVPRYSGTNVTLVLSQAPGIVGATVSGGAFRFPLATATGYVYLVQRSDTLDPANWQTLSSIKGDGSTAAIVDPVSQPQGFYRVIIQ